MFDAATPAPVAAPLLLLLLVVVVVCGDLERLALSTCSSLLRFAPASSGASFRVGTCLFAPLLDDDDDDDDDAVVDAARWLRVSVDCGVRALASP